MMSLSFDEILSPIKWEVFIREYWESKPLHVSRKIPAFYANVLAVDELDEYLSRNDIRYPSLRMIRAGKGVPLSDFSGKLRFGTYESDGLIDVDKVFDLHKAGASIVLQLMRSSLAGVSRFANGLQERLGFNVEATVYITPPSEQGFTTHFDTHSVLVLQVSGKKRWRLYDYPKRLPLLTDTFDTVNYSPSTPSEEILLEEGDLLYVPRGLAHDATSASDTESIHITIGLFPPMWRDLFESHIKGLASNVRFRRAPTSYFFDASKQSFRDECAEVLADAFPPSEAASTLRHVMRQHLARQSRITSGRIRDIGLLPHLNQNTVVRLIEGVLTDVESSPQRIFISFYDKRITFPSKVRVALDRILTGKECSIGSIQENLDEGGRLHLVQRLITEGLIQIV